MIKLILTVDNENVEQDDLVRALHANSAYSCIDDIFGLFRSMLKHGYLDQKELTEDQFNIIDKVQSKLIEITESLPAKY